MTPEQVIALLGRNVIKDHKTDALGGMIMHVTTVPKPHSKMEFYGLVFSRESGLLKIIAYSKDIRTASDGAEVRDSYVEIRNALVAGYGTPADEFDFVKSGSLWDKPEDFVMGLLKKERTLEAYWETKEAKPLKDDLSLVSVEAQAVNSETGYLIITYEFSGWGFYVSRLKSKENAVF